jgi:two-component system LytT family response regulator
MTNKLRSIIVDDEPLARRRLRALLKDLEDVEVIAECSTGTEAVTAIRRHGPDVVFLDIQMPGMDGFDVIRKIGVEKMPVAVFVTAHDEHALRAFEVNAIDYLLKPFDRKRLSTALRRVRRWIDVGGAGEGGFQKHLLDAIDGLKARERFRARFAVKSGGRVYFVPVEEIDWIDAAGKYVRLHAGADEHLLHSPISQVETELDPQNFVRIHRSTIVNIKRIRELQPLFHGEHAVILHDETALRLSRGYRGKLRSVFDLPE